MTTDLADLQSRFQARLLGAGDGMAADLKNGGPHLGVYEHAYRARLIEVLGEDFPALHTLLGDEGFAQATSAYVTDHPSNARSIRWIGARLADWLTVTAPWSDQPVLADMARFEWGLGIAFDAPDAPVVEVTELAAVPPEAWPILTFVFHPALNVFETAFDVTAFQQAVAAERDPDAAPEPLEAPAVWAAWRDPESLQVRYRPLTTDEVAGLPCLMSGGDFAALCQKLADQGGEEDAALRAAGLLRHWVEAGWITDLAAEGMSWS